MDAFTYHPLPTNLTFGHGTIQNLPALLSQYAISHPFLISGQHQKDLATLVTDILAQSATHRVKASNVFSRAEMHSPTAIGEAAVEAAKQAQADGVVSLGGGSAIGLGKTVALQLKLPHIAIPTTYSGSEGTDLLGRMEKRDDGRLEKRAVRDPKILPSAVVYDVDLTMSLPVQISIASGVNAMAHALEAMYVSDTSPVVRLLAVEGWRVLAEVLPEIGEAPHTSSIRERALYGALLCAICAGNVSLGLQHRVAHVLGGAFGLYVFIKVKEFMLHLLIITGHMQLPTH
jgi:alcohol dehydrogenase class IV